MIFVTDATGHFIHASHEWTALTGQTVSDALGKGWLDRVHPGDRATVNGIIQSAISEASQFSMRYRLLRPDDRVRWVGAGAFPSFGMEDSRFIGYLGSVTELAAGAIDTISAYGSVGRYIPPPPHPATMPTSSLDLIADYLILSHSLIEDGEVLHALPDVRAALLKVGLELAARTKAATTLN